MKIGLSVSSSHSVTDLREGPRRMIDRVKAASAAGMDSLFIGDHHAVPTPYYQNVPMLGRLLADWTGPVSGALFLLPLWHPVIVAEQMATMACIHNGKFVMQCGIGAGEAQFGAMSTSQKFRPSAFEQSIETIRQLWTGETVNLNGRWQIRNARINPTPPEPIDIWIGATAPVAIERAARMGDVWLADPGLEPESAKKLMDVYEAALVKANKPTPDTIAIRRDVYIAESADDAKQTRALVESSGYRGIDPDALIIATPDESAVKIEQLGAMGYTDIIVRNLHPDPARAVESTNRIRSVIEALS